VTLIVAQIAPDATVAMAAELLEERAGVREFDGGFPRAEAERLAVDDVAHVLPFTRGTA
jgi:hypothetical protein